MKKRKKTPKLPTGRTLQTRDEFLASGKGKKNIKPEHPDKKDLYRRVGVVDSNYDGDLIIIKLSTKGRHSLNDYLDGKSKYNAYLEVEDNEGKRIRVDGVKFQENSRKRDLSSKQVNEIKYNCLKNPETSRRLRKENKQKIRQIKK